MKSPLILLVAGTWLSACSDQELPTPPVSTPAPAPSVSQALPTPQEPAPVKAQVQAQIQFSDHTEAAGVAFQNWNGSSRDQKRSILDSIGQGSAWLDDDQDGHLDLYVANGSSTEELPDELPTSRFFRNLGDGTFEDVSQASGLASTAWNNGVAAADYDNDGDTDLFVTAWGDHSLYRSDGAGHFEDVAAGAGLVITEFEQTPWGVCSAWGDVDLDGNLDLFVGHYLGFDPANPPHGGETQNWKGMRDAYYGPTGLPTQRDFLFRSLGNGKFKDDSKRAGITSVGAAYSLGAVFLDSNLDGFPDLYVANDSQPNYLFIGDGTGQMIERGAVAGLAYGEQGNAQAGMGVDAADFDGDGDDDIIVTNFDDDVNTLYRNDGRIYRDITVRTGLAGPTRNVLSWGTGFADFDNDNDLDLFIACGHVYPSAETDDPNTKYRQTNQIYQASGTKNRRLKLQTETGTGGAVREVSRGASFADFDGDGDVDIFVTNLNVSGTLMRNDTEPPANWLEVLVIGNPKAGINQDAIGARVTVEAGAHSHSAERRSGQSFLSSNSPWLHFGLGAEGKATQVTVTWPGAAPQTYGPFDANQRIVIRHE